MLSPPPEPPSPSTDAQRRRHDLNSTLTTLRMRAQFLHRVAVR